MKRNKTRNYLGFENYNLTGCREMTMEELLIVNGGKQIENSNEAVANAQVGDTLVRDDKTTVTITQGDIDWAREHCGWNGNTSASTTGSTEIRENRNIESDGNSSLETSQSVINSPEYSDSNWNGIIIKDTPEDQQKILDMINSMSYKQYELKNSALVYTKKNNKHGSKKYSAAIDNIIENGLVIIKMDNTYTYINNKGVESEAPLMKDINGNIMAGYSYSSCLKRKSYVTITGEEGQVFPTEEGYADWVKPERVLMHELAGHVEPIIMNQQSNAITIENGIIQELYLLNPYSNTYLPRMPNENHYSIPLDMQRRPL